MESGSPAQKGRSSQSLFTKVRVAKAPSITMSPWAKLTPSVVL